MVRGLLRSLAAALALALGGAAHGSPIAWVEMVESGAEARIVTVEAECPAVMIDGHNLPSHERAAPSEGFNNRVCAVALPHRTRSVSVEGVGLPMPKARPNVIVVIGDTGCRLKGVVTQHCNDPSGWPFAHVAALAASHHPDLVVHVGDYYYREAPCPMLMEAACGGSPYGDRWATWRAEVFDPAAPLLAAAPWIFARGNHEDCKRGGAGWFRLLDAAPAPKPCPAQSDTFSVPIGGARLFMVDSADTEDLSAPEPLVAAFAARLNPVKGSPGEPAWIVTHRPVWNVARLGPLLGDGLVNATERAAVQRASLPGVDLILSGHVHNFAAMSFGARRPSQLVVGTSGDLLDLNAAPPPASGIVNVDRLTAHAFSMGRFGYFLMERQPGGGWRGAFHDLNDQVHAVCAIKGRTLSCKAA